VGGIKPGKGNWSSQKKSALVLLCPQSPHDLTWNQTWAIMLGSQQLTYELLHGLIMWNATPLAMFLNFLALFPVGWLISHMANTMVENPLKVHFLSIFPCESFSMFPHWSYLSHLRHIPSLSIPSTLHHPNNTMQSVCKSWNSSLCNTLTAHFIFLTYKYFPGHLVFKYT
jgi:hypothetical protein